MWSSHTQNGCRASHFICIIMLRGECNGVPQGLREIVSYTGIPVECMTTNAEVYTTDYIVTNVWCGGNLNVILTIPPYIMDIPMGHFHDGTVKRVGNIKRILLGRNNVEWT